MTYEQALAYIHQIPTVKPAPGMERIFDLLERIGNPQRNLKFVHVAGTNGKGSTAAMTACILREAGYRTGLYTSPFLMRFNERIAVDGGDIPDQDLADATEFVMPHADAMAVRPTEFELVTAIALTYFAHRACDIVVLEVGVGGLVDATNAIETPEAAIITNIGLDHTGLLGNTLAEIAANKAGIIKPGCHAITYPGDPSVEAVFEAVCREKHAVRTSPDFHAIHLKSHGLDGQVFDYGPWQDVHLPLLGAHQLRNAAMVLTAVKALRAQGWRISDENVYEGIASVKWPCRFELLRRSPAVIVDGGHNPQCLEALAQNVRDYLSGCEITALTGVMADKDYTDMYAYMAPYITRFVTVTPDNPRAMASRDLAQVLDRFGKPVTVCEAVADGVRTALAQTPENGAVLTFGSLYLAGDVRRIVLEG